MAELVSPVAVQPAPQRRRRRFLAVVACLLETRYYRLSAWCALRVRTMHSHSHSSFLPYHSLQECIECEGDGSS